ncbi:protein containing DUF1232 [Candidatus Magnetobacterium bavaricum]|uniref:Protein containing DUF1232 n=1 Tax=Candidatus Magnetobacterium bavaricum TaxID=29290 RepID=A0A0F3GLW3_9BACT|nr:protein containing DUF1232 [Candidatus Magnetobacterium bavaricum]
MKLLSGTLKELRGRLLKKDAKGHQYAGKPADKATVKSLKLPLLLMLLTLVYDVSPVDIIPDVPIVGWIDDFFVTAAAALNVLHALVGAQNSALAMLVGILKWMVIFVGVIAVCLVLISMLGIIKLITS